MLYPFHLHIVVIFNPYPDWETFFFVFPFGQHLVWWEGLFPLALWKMPFYNALQNALFQNSLFKKGIMNKSILSNGIGVHFWRANVKCSLALKKIPSYIPWQNALIKNALWKKGFLNKGILSRDIGGHFWKGKRAFPPNRQKPIFFTYFTKTEMLPKLKCHQNWSVTKTELSPKLKCHQNWSVT